MAKYRKKPVVMEAIRYNGLNIEAIEQFVGMVLMTEFVGLQKYVNCDGRKIDNIIIPTLQGDMIAMPGDYIIKGIQGEFYPCKPDIFEKTYELVEE